MAKFIFTELVGVEAVTVRLGSGTGSGNNYSDTEKGKLVKLVGDSRYALCSSGDPIEGEITSLEPATADGYTIGGIQVDGRLSVVAAGLQATEGTGTLAIGDYVVAGTQDAKGTALTTAYAKVVKATAQPGATAADLAGAGAQMKVAMFAWRVVSLGSVGTGAVGTTVLVERVND